MIIKNMLMCLYKSEMVFTKVLIGEDKEYRNILNKKKEYSNIYNLNL